MQAPPFLCLTDRHISVNLINEQLFNKWEECMLSRRETVEATRAGFEWQIPTHFNIGVDVCDRWADAAPDRIALVDVNSDGRCKEYSFEDLRASSNRLANVLDSKIQVGDRVAILLPQSLETAVSHIAAYKAGAIALPLFTLFGPDALKYRLQDSGAKVVITNAEGARRISEMRSELVDLETVICTDGAITGAHSFKELCAVAPVEFQPLETLADDPALLIYTSGTTGNPKGALHAHRVLLGHLPGVEMSHDFLPQPNDKIWTPADWAWIGGLLDVLLPALHHGIPVVARRFEKFTAQAAFDLIRDHKIQNAFLPPTALKMMRQFPDGERYGLKMRSVASGGEALGKELLDWGQKVFGVTINEFYGQTECNMIVSSCGALTAPEPGVMGFAVPGHEVDVLDSDTGASLNPEELGDIAVQSPDPVMFLRYWGKPEATKEKFRKVGETDWLLTGDRGYKTADGRIAFVGREDDVISSSGYRIGPAEIEDCLITHPAVQMAGVVGKPDDLRGEIVVAFVQLAPDAVASPTLAKDIQDHVKTMLAAYEYPREVHFVESLPLTTTGKIIRNDLRTQLAAQSSGA